jgi:signal transduction histidine kinase
VEGERPSPETASVVSAIAVDPPGSDDATESTLIDTTRYLQASRPPHLLALMRPETLQDLLNGFRFRLGAGMTALYADNSGGDAAPVGRRPTTGGQAQTHAFCDRYRSMPGGNDRCMAWDIAVARKYYSGEWTNPQVFRCHAQMWDMAWPLRVGDVLLGVLFAGQIVVDGSDVDWPTALASIWDRVYVDPAKPMAACQVDDILAALETQADTSACVELRDFIQAREMQIVRPEDLIGFYDEFLQFGQTMDSLLADLHQSKAEAEGQRLLQEVDNVLAKSGPDNWWDTLASVARSFSAATDAGSIQVWRRDASRYTLVADTEGPVPSAARSIPARHCLGFAANQIINASEIGEKQELKASLDMDGKAWCFRYDQPEVEDHDFSLLFVLSKRPSKYVEEFIQTVAVRAQVDELLVRVKRDGQEFEKRVRTISHSAKTPLHIAFTEIHNATLLLDAGTGPEPVKAHLAKVSTSIRRSQAEMALIHGQTVRRRCRVDLGDMLQSLALDMTPLADEKRCRIEVDLPTRPLPVNVCQEEMTVALRNLVDNAIKYSFKGSWIAIKARPVPVDRVEVVFENYGVGIPDDRRDQILDVGGRGEVEDPTRHPRPGSGLGVPIALDILHEHGGTLDFESSPTYRTEPGTWLHHRIRAIVTLPLIFAKSHSYGG